MAFSHVTTRRVGAAAAGLLLALAFSPQVQAAQTSGRASASILAPIIMTKVDDLAFGKVIAGPSASTVTISPLGNFTCGTGLTCLDAHNPARFSVTAAPGQVLRVDIDQQIILTSQNGGRMTATLQTTSGVMRMPENNGALVVGVGGILNVGAYQAEGTYTGTFTVNIDYS
jgi:Mat/Ecp fimbriae major subunit